jgi:hypothetical protein
MAAHRFLAWFAATSALLAVGVLGLTWLVDPYGLLAARGPRPSVCVPGIRVNDDRYLKAVMPRVHQPKEVILGSSRAAWGFREEAFTRRTANLALSSGSLEQIDRLARQAVADAPVERLWIGLDFGAFILPGAGPDTLTRLWPIADPGATALRYGLLDPHAMKAGWLALADPAACRDPPFSLLGFARVGPYGRTPWSGPRLPDLRTRSALVHNWREEARGGSSAYADRLGRLDALLSFLRSRRAEAMLFITPSHPVYHEMVAEAGLGGRYRRWRGDIQAIARRHDTILVLSDAPAFLRAVNAPDCPAPALPEYCLFYDSTHFRPVVGDAIVSAALAMQQSHPGL